jgi:hypothetical protein
VLTVLPLGEIARASVRHGAVGLGVLTLLPAVVLARAVRFTRGARVTQPTSGETTPRCAHRPVCPPPDAPGRDAARVVATHPDQGWSLLCNGVVLFDDLGEILPDGHVRGTGRQQQVALLRRYGSRRRRAAAPSPSTPRAA